MIQSNIDNFVSDIENLYNSISIYRSIIITNNYDESSVIYDKLCNLNHNPYIFYNNIDYNYRLFIVCKNDFDIFIKNINENSYDYICISYSIIDTELLNMITIFLDNTNNNKNRCYIMDSNNRHDKNKIII